MDLVSTPVGTAGITWYPAHGPARAVALLGHGTATGVEAADLQALAAALPGHGVTVALVTQPYRMNHTRHGSDEASLDAVWRAVWPIAADLGVPVISGGRSAGSQVACRTAEQLGAHAVLALAYPLLGPGSPAELLATGRPTLVLQGTRDPFGRPDQFPALPPEIELVEIPNANHTFDTPGSIARSATMRLITDETSQWIKRQLTRT
jgi:predicted alpha/beta-hydrolase family hydrolase